MTGRLVAVVLFLIAVMLYVSALRAKSELPAAAVDVSRIPLVAAGYEADEQSLDERVLDELGADETLYRAYRRSGRPPIWLFLGYFAEPRENSQIHSPKHCYPGSGWNVTEEFSTLIDTGGDVISAKSLVISNGREHQLVIYWFNTDSGTITNEYALKWDQMKSALRRRSQRATFIRFSTPFAGEEDRVAAHRELTDFAAALSRSIVDALNVTGRSS